MKEGKYLIPRAKRVLHECVYHLDLMKSSKSAEELEINFSAFLNSTRNVTFALQKEFAGNKKFTKWYKKKMKEMTKEPLLLFFVKLRNRTVKEGITGLKGISLTIKSLDTSKDLINKPEGSANLIITRKGPYWNVFPNSPKADLLPADTTGEIYSVVALEGIPKTFLGKELEPNISKVCDTYYLYLKQLVEECTEIVNS